MKHLKTYEELSISDESDQIAHDELFGVKATLAFDFNREFIDDVDAIKDLIEKYNHFYIKEKSWSGGPPPRSFVEYFNKTYSKKGNASLSTWYPTIDLIIETKNYGNLILGFSIIDKSYKLFNWGGLAIPDVFTTGNREESFNKNVLSEIGKYVREQLNKMTLEEVIDELNLDVKNYFEWNWKQTINESVSNIDEIKSNLKDLCLEFEDNNCQCEIEYYFYIDIDIDIRIMPMLKRNTKIVSYFPEWFIENCREIESYMNSEGFKTLPSIKYALNWEKLDSIDELAESIGVIYKVRLEFLPI